MYQHCVGVLLKRDTDLATKEVRRGEGTLGRGMKNMGAHLHKAILNRSYLSGTLCSACFRWSTCAAASSGGRRRAASRAAGVVSRLQGAAACFITSWTTSWRWRPRVSAPAALPLHCHSCGWEFACRRTGAA